MDNGILKQARAYLNRGFSVIPLRPYAKLPDGEVLPFDTNAKGSPIIDANTGQRKRTWRPYQFRHATSDELTEWFGSGHRNIGIITGSISGLAVVDFDSTEAIEFARMHSFRATPLVKTARGFHAYYRFREGITNFQKRADLPGIDLRGQGGYVVAPPSIHSAGKQYEWVEGKGLDDLPLAELPEIFVAKTPEPKTPLAELYQGVPEGMRNDSLTRIIGSLANDGLSLDECLSFALTWNEKNTPPLPVREVEATVKSIFNRHQHKNTDEHQTMVLTKLDDLLREPEEPVTWVLDGILPTGGFSLLASKPKVGKSTFARNLAKSTAMGATFLGRSVSQGPVLYLALEEKRGEVRRHFRDMGASGAIYIYAGGAPADALLQIRVIVDRIRPVLVIIDPLFRLTRIKDSNAYAEVTQALEPLLRLARDTGTHVLCVHHTGKGERSDGDCILGSTAIFGTVDTLFLMRRHEHYRTVKTIQRYGEDLEETTLHFDKGARTIEIGMAKHEEDVRYVKNAILDFLGSQTEPKSEAEIVAEIEGRNVFKRVALRDLVRDGELIRDGKGTRGDPFKYSYTLVPTYIRVQENENKKNDVTTHNQIQNDCTRKIADDEENGISPVRDFDPSQADRTDSSDEIIEVLGVFE